MAETEFRCPHCGGEGPFYRYEYLKSPVCVACAKKRGRDWRAANPQRQRQLQRRGHLREMYGLSEEAYAQLLEAQGDSCAICRDASNDGMLCVDHDHVTGEVRGLLCDRCNHGLGHFKDDPERMLAAIRYLESPPARTFRVEAERWAA